jgi:hypothetical protein
LGEGLIHVTDNVTHNVSTQAPPPKWNMPKHAQTNHHQMSPP